MHYVYLIESERDTTKRYVGFTDDMKQRLADHNAGKSKHTSAHRPWRLETYVGFRNREWALAFERYLKIGSGHAFARRHFWN
ncbi:MAG: GIY-YIG nuclease family protein [Verrucomicrobia bacterium]|nr:GIY-YIG nuclease family protein [Verrucomicrobiota bacterium]